MDRTKNRECKACKKAKAAKYVLENPEASKARSAAWYANNRTKAAAAHAAYRLANAQKKRADTAAWRLANPERSKAYAEAWRIKNKEKLRAQNAERYAANPEAARIHWRNRRARKKEVGGNLSRGLAEKLWNLQKGSCACCKEPLGDNYHLDHIMPLALGGTNTDDNIQLLRAVCNLQKSTKHPVDFMQSRGFLL